MPSNVDVNQPPFGNPTTGAVRTNFATIKAEIEALQSNHGFVNYVDVTTQSAPISVLAGVYKKLTNDTLGAGTVRALPTGVTNVWNPVTNQFTFAELPINTTMDGRFDLAITTTVANQDFNLSAFIGLGTASEREIFLMGRNFKTAGTYKFSVNSGMYVDSTNIKDFPGELRAISDGNCTVKVNSFYIRVVKQVGV